MLCSSHGGKVVISKMLINACDNPSAKRLGARSYTHDQISPPVNVRAINAGLGKCTNEKIAAEMMIAGATLS